MVAVYSGFNGTEEMPAPSPMLAEGMMNEDCSNEDLLATAAPSLDLAFEGAIVDLERHHAMLKMLLKFLVEGLRRKVSSPKKKFFRMCGDKNVT
jgi:hypothetical protein